MRTGEKGKKEEREVRKKREISEQMEERRGRIVGRIEREVGRRETSGEMNKRGTEGRE